MHDLQRKPWLIAALCLRCLRISILGQSLPVVIQLFRGTIEELKYRNCVWVRVYVLRTGPERKPPELRMYVNWVWHAVPLQGATKPKKLVREPSVPYLNPHCNGGGGYGSRWSGGE